MKLDYNSQSDTEKNGKQGYQVSTFKTKENILNKVLQIWSKKKKKNTDDFKCISSILSIEMPEIKLSFKLGFG